MQDNRGLSEVPASSYVKKLFMKPYMATKRRSRIKIFLLGSTIWNDVSICTSNSRNPTKASNVQYLQESIPVGCVPYVCCNDHQVGVCPGGVICPGGVCPGGCLSRGVSAPGVSAQGGCLSRGYLPQGCLSREGCLPRGVYPSMH